MGLENSEELGVRWAMTEGAESLVQVCPRHVQARQPSAHSGMLPQGPRGDGCCGEGRCAVRTESDGNAAGRAGQDYRLHPVRNSDRGPQCGPTAHRLADHVRSINRQQVHDFDQIRDCRYRAVVAVLVGRAAESSLIPADHPIVLSEVGHLLVPDGRISAETVRENQIRALAGSLVPDPFAVCDGDEALGP